MNTQSIGSASRVICEAMGRPNAVPATIAVALDANGLLNTVETAAELVALRDRVAELEALEPATYQTCPTCHAAYRYGTPCSTCAFQAQVAAARNSIATEFPHVAALLAEDPHDGPLHHDYRLGHDLPETS